MQNFLENLAKVPVNRSLPKTLPETPGVYIFWGEKSYPIYIGKAINLKRRVSSYFDLNLEPKTARMVSEATHFSYVQVTSELESLLLEARLIRKFMPQYNIAAKDDKHPLYIQITNELYPRILTARKIAEKQKNKAFYGPFPSSTNVRSVLRMLRRIFPYSDHKIGKRGCLYSHIGLCKPCPNEIEKIEDPELKKTERNKYLRNIRNIKAILDGKIADVRHELEVSMLNYSKSEDFETAAGIRDQIKRLEYITQPQIPTEYFMENPNLYQDIRQKELKELRGMISKYMKIGELTRIECFDVAHLAGTNPTASMVTFVDGEAEKKYYRHFKIFQNKGNSDVDSMKEVITRRKKHLEDWGSPNLIIVDGGKAQVGVFIRELSDTNIPVVGLAKRFETLVIPAYLDGTLRLKEYKVPRGNALNLVTRIRDEAHRFARKYHHVLISKEITATSK